MDNTNYNPITPKHYNSTKISPIEAIEDWNLGFALGNVIKYVGRAGKKDSNTILEDLEKAKWYLEREINNLKNN